MLPSFTKHPHAVGETYGEHMGASWRIGFTLLGAGLACLMHGLFPFLFQTTGSRTIARLYAKTTGRKPAEAGFGEWEGAGV